VTIPVGATLAAIPIAIPNNFVNGAPATGLKAATYEITGVTGATAGHIFKSIVDIDPAASGRAQIKGLLTALNLIVSRLAAKSETHQLTLGQLDDYAAILLGLGASAKNLNLFYSGDKPFDKTFREFQGDLTLYLRSLSKAIPFVTIDGYTAQINQGIATLETNLAKLRAAATPLAQTISALPFILSRSGALVRYRPALNSEIKKGRAVDSAVTAVLNSLPGDLTSLDNTVSTMGASGGLDRLIVQQSLVRFADASGRYLELYQTLKKEELAFAADLNVLELLAK
jgi:hypothetical protein